MCKKATLLALLLLGACRKSSEPQPPALQQDLGEMTFSDDIAHGVRCYRFYFREGISCLRVLDGGQ